MLNKRESEKKGEGGLTQGTLQVFKSCMLSPPEGLDNAERSSLQ